MGFLHEFLEKKNWALLFRNQLFLVFSHERYSTVDSVIIHTSESRVEPVTWPSHIAHVVIISVNRGKPLGSTVKWVVRESFLWITHSCASLYCKKSIFGYLISYSDSFPAKIAEFLTYTHLHTIKNKSEWARWPRSWTVCTRRQGDFQFSGRWKPGYRKNYDKRGF